MIISEYYQNYKGPELIFAEIWEDSNKKQDITEYIHSLYWEERNLKGMLLTYKDVFPDKKGYHFYIEFQSKERKHWFHGMVGEDQFIFNIPLATPMNQNNI